ncbi:MAG: glycerol-3-phosphate 1-O-acyltransferase PlsY [Alphaproteobacteria bacterium]|nr:glycerol-3-phosphate 1-O-acyltransferase PlsY [Alphaproteobacteria bacterium]
MIELFNPSLLIMVLIAYLLGSVPFGLLFYYLKTGKDLRKIGSGNIGATNVYRASGIKLAIVTFIFDSGKAALMSLLALNIFGINAALMVGLAAIIGHNFSCFLGFKGGKGVASSLAVMLVLNWQIALIGCVVWLAILAVFRTSSVSALIGFVVMLIVALFIAGDISSLVAALLLTGLVFIKHLANIKRIFNGTEPHTIGNKTGDKYFSLTSKIALKTGDNNNEK